MKTRKASYADYGISKEECEKLLEMCRNAEGDTEQALLAAVQESNEVMAADLFNSLRNGVSFDEIDKHKYDELSIDNKLDFYAYRRKALYLFKEKLIKTDKTLMERWRNDGYIRRYCKLAEAAEELQTSQDHARVMAKRASALTKFGGVLRVNMIALYQYIDRECAVQ